MLEPTLDTFLGKDVIIHLFNHQLDRGELNKVKGKYGCKRDGEITMLYDAHVVVGIEEVGK